jgi:sugar phosphate isomerase/epimerase
MKSRRSFLSALACLPAWSLASGQAGPLFARENLLAWCIVPYDAKKRGPAERVAMLRRLGISQYVWDWRAEHLPQLPEELRAARAGGVRVRGVWLWIDATRDQPAKPAADNAAVLQAVADAGVPMEFWVGFHDNVFAGRDDAACLAKATEWVAALRDHAAKAGGTIALYNHGGWFGEPENQLRVIAALGDPRVGIVYNFHHGQAQIDRFATFLPRMLPHLRAVNLNGMKPGGPKILPVGAGTHEGPMLRQLAASGYRGPIGLLCHVEDADAEEVLRANLEGLRRLARAE